MGLGRSEKEIFDKKNYRDTETRTTRTTNLTKEDDGTTLPRMENSGTDLQWVKLFGVKLRGSSQPTITKGHQLKKQKGNKI